MEQTTAPSSNSALLENSDMLADFSETETAEGVTRYVVVEVNHNFYGVSTDSTIELTSGEMTMITRVPHAPAYIAGVLNHRGTIIPVVDLRELLGFSPRSAETERLSKKFAQFKQDHVEWIAALKDAVNLDKEFRKSTDPSQCSFGKWYESVIEGSAQMSEMVSSDPTLRTLFERFDAPHKKIHEVAKTVLQLKEEGKTDEAIEEIDLVRDTELALMCEIFDQVIETIATKLDSMLVITEIGDSKAAIAVDSVSYVADCRDDDVELLPDTAENTDFISGLVYQDDGSYILLVDLQHIYSTACPNE